MLKQNYEILNLDFVQISSYRIHFYYQILFNLKCYSYEVSENEHQSTKKFDLKGRDTVD